MPPKKVVSDASHLTTIVKEYFYMGKMGDGKSYSRIQKLQNSSQLANQLVEIV
jgi:hypothetical protein